MKNLVVIVSFLVASMSMNAQSAAIVVSSGSQAPVKQNSGVTTASTPGFDLSKEETETVHKLLNLTPAQYKSVYDIYVAKNAKIEAAKVKYANDAQTYSSEALIAENSADQFISQQLTDVQMPKWMDTIRAKHNSHK